MCCERGRSFAAGANGSSSSPSSAAAAAAAPIREDPLHVPAFHRMSESLPFAKHTHSKLVCHITRHIMDEDNPPMVGGGSVYTRARFDP